VFLLSPINISLPIKIVDHWLDKVGIKRPLAAEIKLFQEIVCESKLEAISAKIHGSQLSLRDDGTLLWAERIILALCHRGSRGLSLTASEGETTNLNEFRIQELVSTLFELNVLSSSVERRSKRKR
jgi:hypothetical protein